MTCRTACEEVTRDFGWVLGLGLEDSIPESRGDGHSTAGREREREREICGHSTWEKTLATGKERKRY